MRLHLMANGAAAGAFVGAESDAAKRWTDGKNDRRAVEVSLATTAPAIRVRATLTCAR